MNCGKRDHLQTLQLGHSLRCVTNNCIDTTITSGMLQLKMFLHTKASSAEQFQLVWVLDSILFTASKRLLPFDTVHEKKEKRNSHTNHDYGCLFYIYDTQTILVSFQPKPFCSYRSCSCDRFKFPFCSLQNFSFSAKSFSSIAICVFMSDHPHENKWNKWIYYHKNKFSASSLTWLHKALMYVLFHLLFLLLLFSMCARSSVG